MSSNNKYIIFRPHHFMCTIGYQGLGYSQAFILNYNKIITRIKNNPDILIKIRNNLDNICYKCPHKKYNICESQEQIQELDRAHSQILELKAGQIISWREAQIRIKEKMTLELFKEACKSCEWQKLGICEKALKSLKI